MSPSLPPSVTPFRSPLIVDRYAIYGEIASGGMATVHFARLLGAHGFSRTVAAKRLLPHLSRDHDFALMLVDEARLAARINHPNVVSTLDVVQTDTELVLVMDYVHGESLAKLMESARQRGEGVPTAIAIAIMIEALHGLHAAHEARDERGEPLGIVHRDVSPQNLLIGVDGVARIVDFGVAKAAGRSQVTRDGAVKGKLSYMSPEQIEQGEVTRASDVFSASVVLWEALTGIRLFQGENAGQIVYKVVAAQIPLPSSVAPGLPTGLDAIVTRGLAAKASERFATAREMALALEQCAPPIRPSDVGAWVEQIAAGTLAQRARLLSAVEDGSPEDLAPGTAVYPRPVERSGRARSEPSPAASTRIVPSPSSSAPRLHAEPGVPTDTNAVTETAHARPDRKRVLTTLGLVALLLAAAGGMYLSFSAGQVQHRASALESAAVSAPTPLSASAAPSASANPSAALVPAASERPAPHPAKPERAPGRPHVAGAPRPNCDPPYSIDAAGRHIFKVDCM